MATLVVSFPAKRKVKTCKITSTIHFAYDRLDELIPSDPLTPSHPDSIMETCSVVLTFESVDEILWCDHSNETLSAILLQGTCTTCFSIFYEMKFGILYEFLCLHSWELRVKVVVPVVQSMDSTIYRINLYHVDSAIGFVNVYPLDCDLSSAGRYPRF